MAVKIERIYAKQQSEGIRILIDRVWPRGISKSDAHIDMWLKEVAPTKSLRQWFHHDLNKFDAFRNQYIAELQHNDKQIEAYQTLVEQIRTTNKDVILLYGAKDTTYNHAVVLRDYLKQ
ncbi:DUF488 domain-containing protein [Staphylococcus sp. 17KM0847]|uniref:DUF488 domain-containing protein n=1 Tax=Staphylococcus sp. 17KM0847 TaxID=2583989 RepID=UPI0015DCD4FE|nr:DUF488 family protein [Staphylococcus sp. 17KM0847]QLK86816.1 DUF488 family protein [Staphylococcus sp. 17KM0847]